MHFVQFLHILERMTKTSESCASCNSCSGSFQTMLCGYETICYEIETTLMSTHAVQHITETKYTFPKLLQICSHMASFGYLSVQMLIKPFSNPDTPSRSHCKFAPIWLHLDTFPSRSGSGHFRTQIHLQNCCRFASIWLHLDTFLSRYKSSHFQAQVHLPKSIANEKPSESYASCN